MQFEEGDLYSQTLLETSESNLRATGFFEGADIKKHPDPISPDKCIVETNVSEAKTGMFQVSGSYSTSEGPMVNLAYGEQNFLGTGKSLQLSLHAGRSLIGPGYAVRESGQIDKIKRQQQFEILKSANLSISDSHLFGRDLTGGISLFKYTSTPFDNFLLKNYGASIDLSYALGNRVTQSWELGIARRTVDHIDEMCSPLVKAQLVKYDKDKKEFKMNEQRNGLQTSLQTSFNYLYPIYDGPLKGQMRFKWSTALLHDGGFNSTFWKNIFSASYNKMLSRNVGLTLQSSYGILTPLKNNGINIIDSFASSGESIRGFDEGSCCPHFVITRRNKTNINIEDKNKPISYVDATGAKKFINGTVSVSFPIGLPTELNFKTFIFTDFGYYWDPIVPQNYKDYLEEQDGEEEITYNKQKLKVNKASCEADDKLHGKDKNEYKCKITGYKLFTDHSFGVSIGIGISFDSPFGPIALSWAIPIKKSTFDKKKIFNFGLKMVL